MNPTDSGILHLMVWQIAGCPNSDKPMVEVYRIYRNKNVTNFNYKTA